MHFQPTRFEDILKDLKLDSKDRQILELCHKHSKHELELELLKKGNELELLKKGNELELLKKGNELELLKKDHEHQLDKLKTELSAANWENLKHLKLVQGMLEPDDREVVDVTEVRARMERHNDHYQAEQKQRFDSKRKPVHLYSEGDLVLIKITSTPATGVSHKLLPKWRGPFRITKVLGNDRYEVADIPGSCRSRLRYSGVAGVDNMRPWIYCE
ncbi:hypothetical protein TcasGA2_TC016160 [Tribolium castaneum]|uniref:Uncharacterized protein n=1 Tax=Tribolium castaneum TaxID=7070 RepID=D6WBH4_TRICA|nr:hypothetical protein TcasGA2_TC016160 [Tribolium castaneum]